MNNQDSTKKEFPDEINSRLNCWHKLYRQANSTHYIVGLLGVAASALAAVDLGEASRILDSAAIRYGYGRVDLDYLFKAMDQGGRLIAGFEQELSTKAQIQLSS